MVIATTVKEVRQQIREWRREGYTVGLVPTMGALHEGHASLVDAAKTECDKAVASVFVNPAQFGKNEDISRYPRTFEGDCRVLEEHGCDMVFHPGVEEIYPDGFATYVEVQSDMTSQLCGKSRPGHFKGVCTVVSKLFNIVTPDRAYFGEKDAQQLAVIRRMTKDMGFGLEIVGCPTVREEDGLAKSSRNAYMNEEERRSSAIIYRSIAAAEKLIEQEEGNDIDAGRITSLMREILSEDDSVEIEYVDAVDGSDLSPVERLKDGDLVAVAVSIGSTRLIDNFTVGRN